MPKSKKSKAKIKCAARDCEEMFTPRVKGQKFHSRKCNNREWSRIYRERHPQAVTA